MHQDPRTHTSPRRRTRRRLALLALAALIGTMLGIVPLSPPAQAAGNGGSIVFVKDHDVWIAAGDGSRARPVTASGEQALPWSAPSQSDTGIIVATRYQRIVVMNQHGRVLREIDPPPLPTSLGGTTDGTPVHLAISPDGSLVAYTFSFHSCDQGCRFRTATGYIRTDGTGTPAHFGTSYLHDPSWVGNSRTLQSGGYGSHVTIHDVGSAQPQHWFDDGDIWSPSTDYGNVEVSPDGTLLAGVRGYGDQTSILTYTVNGNVRSGPPPADPSGLCLYSDPQPRRITDPTWSPDSVAVAWSEVDGIWVAENARSASCDGPVRLLIPGGSQPDWSAAALSAPVLSTVSAPRVTGSAVVGATLTASPGTWTVPPTSVSYQWLRNGTPIAGATGRSYQVALGDAGDRLGVRVTATRAGWATGVATIPSVQVSTRLRNVVRPRTQGIPQVGRVLRATAGTWSPSASRVTYRWLRNGRAIRGATGQRYRLTRGDAGDRISVRVTAYRANLSGSATSAAVRVRR